MIETLVADDNECQNPWCPKPDKMPEAALWAHSLDPPKHENINQLITACSVCHDRYENGFNKEWISMTGDPPYPVEMRRTTGLEYEIAVLEDIQKNRPDHYRWGEVLEKLYQRRKI